MSLIHGDATIVQYVAPSGQVVPLSGNVEIGVPGVWLGAGPQGLGHVDVKSLWDAGAMDEGEDYIGGVIDHAEIDIPLHILGTSNSDFQRRKEWFKSLLLRDRQGWLCVYQNALGWRSVAVRRGSFKPAYGTDPAVARGATFDTILLVDKPHARTADDTDEWTNETGATTGSLYLYPGDEADGWPKFIFTGPGKLRLIYAGMDIDAIPEIGPGREIFIETDMRIQTIRERAAQSSDRGLNLWRQMKGQHFPNAILAGEVTRIRFEVTGASAATKLWATVPQRHEGLV